MLNTVFFDCLDCIAFRLEIQGFFCGFDFSLQSAMADAAERKPRRSSQHYGRVGNFLTASQWRHLSDLGSTRGRAEYLAEICFGMGLRLPTEQTFGAWTALLGLMEQNDAVYHLHVVLQTVKSAWKAVNKRMLKFETPEESARHLLPALPNDWAGLPEYAQRAQGEQPLDANRRPYREQQLFATASKVALRGNHGSVSTLVRGPSAAAIDQSGFLQLARGAAQFMSAMYRQPEPALPGFKILSPSKTPNKQLEVSRREALAPLMNDTAASSSGEPARERRPLLQLLDEAASPVKGGDLKKAEELEVKLSEGQQQQEHKTSVYKDQAAAVEEALRAKSSAKRHSMARPAAADGVVVKKRPAAVASLESSGPAQKKAAQPKGGVKKRPSAGSMEDAESASVQGDAEQEFKNCCFSSDFWGDCKAEFYRDKSYIRAKHEGSYKMIIGCSQTARHKHVCFQLIKYVKQGRSKEELLELRAALLRRSE